MRQSKLGVNSWRGTRRPLGASESARLFKRAFGRARTELEVRDLEDEAEFLAHHPAVAEEDLGDQFRLAQVLWERDSLTVHVPDAHGM